MSSQVAHCTIIIKRSSVIIKPHIFAKIKAFNSYIGKESYGHGNFYSAFVFTKTFAQSGMSSTLFAKCLLRCFLLLLFLPYFREPHDTIYFRS